MSVSLGDCYTFTDSSDSVVLESLVPIVGKSKSRDRRRENGLLVCLTMKMW